MSKFIQTFRVYAVFCADHFGNQFFRFDPIFRDNDQILFKNHINFWFSGKEKRFFYRKISNTALLVTEV
jgi:hypothetical protein